MPHELSRLAGRLRALLTVLVLLPAALCTATQIHVSPAGNDANPGSLSQPVATPQRARDLVRGLITGGLSEPVEIIFATGTYVMAAPLELRPEDSGTAAFPITWKAAAGAEVVLSGGRPITSTWTNGGGGIWFTDLAGTGLAANQWNFRQLFVDGSRATRARFPNITAANPFLYATGGNFDHVIINPALVKTSWGTAADAQTNVVPQSRFFNQWNTVTAVNTSTGRIDIADSERHRSINSGSWFWIEGVQAELDEPGEWFLNPTTGRLSYMPPASVDPNTQTIIAPFLNRIINVKGDINTGTHVAHLHFDGLKFRHTSFTLGHIEARVHTDTAIMFENTNHSSVKNCYFENIGGYALWLHLDSQHNVFDHNTVQYSGGGGILLTGSRFAYMDDSKIHTPGEAAAKVAPILNRITHNTVEHCGKIRYYGGGVHLDSRPFSMTMAPGNYIAHNLFNDLSRNGVFAFRNQGGNVVEYNHIHNAMQTTIDGAAIHFATMNTLNAPNHILNNWLYDIWGWSQNSSGTPTRSLGNGVFLDWDTSNTTVKDNWIYNSVSGAVKVIFGGNQNVVQSGNQSSSTVITPPFVAQVGPDGTATNGINMETNKLTGSIVSYQDTPSFSKTGTWTEETAIGIVNLFEFKFLTATAAVPSQATYTLPITEDGNYQISLLYKPGSNRASNVPVAIDHADGISNITWNMRTGSNYGFAVPIGNYRFVAAQTNTVTLATTGTNGKVIADSVAFVKVDTALTSPSRFIARITQGTPQRVVLYGTSLTVTGAWVPQLKSAVDGSCPGMVTWINSGGSGKASDWGVTNLQTKVIDQNPDTVFIEFSMNDAATTLNISRTQALANLTGMVDNIKSAHPDCEIILQIMNPVDRRETDTYSPRPELALYQQDYRDFAVANGLQCIDHMPAFTALLDEGSTAYRGFVPDGVHPSTEGFARYMTPVLLQDIGHVAAVLTDPSLVIDNSDPAPAIVFNGTWTSSTSTPGYIGADYRHNGNAGQGSKSAVFTPIIPTAGTYPIYLRWTAEANRATNVPVTVNYNGGSQNLTVDQTNNSGIWVSLGSFPLAAGSSATVTIGTTAANGYVIVDALGVGLDPQNQPTPTVRVRMDNARAAEPAVPGGPARASSLIVWRSGPTQAALTVPLDFTGGISVSGSDYTALPTNIIIPAGQASAAVELLPLHDLLIEGDETFKVSLLPAAGYTTDYPNKASIVIEDRTSGGANVAPVASAVLITGTAAIGETLQGNYSYSDAEGDAQGASTFRWLRSADETLDGSDTSVGNASSYGVQAADSGKWLFFEVTPQAATGDPTGSAAASAGVLVANLPPMILTPTSWKQSNSFSTARAASNLSNALGMDPTETFLYNQDATGGVNPSETTGADGKYWVTTSGGNEGAAAAAGKVWIVADLGANHHLTTLKIWNFNWDNTAGTPETSLNNRGVSQFDVLVRDSEADTSTGLAGGSAINLNNPVDGNIDDDAVFNLGTSNTWTTAISNQAFAVAANNDAHAATSFDLTGQTARFVAIRVDSYYGENGVGLGKVRFEGTLVGGTAFADWLADKAPATDFIADSDNDGLPNGVEHVMGSNPNTHNSGLTEVSSTPTSATFEHPLNPVLASDVTYAYQWSTDLVNWYASGGTNTGGTSATITPSSPDANQVVTVLITITTGPATKLFGRLQARLVP